MERNNFKLKLINELIKESHHVRALANEIKTNHTTVLRKLKELCQENVLDYREEGKNKVYFLKKTPESQAYVFMAENYKLNCLLSKYPNLRGIIEKIQKDKKINLAVIFGSYAKGLARKNSDVDVYVETLNKKIREDLELFSFKLSVKIGKYDKKNLLIKEIERNHVIIKGVEKFYANVKFFE